MTYRRHLTLLIVAIQLGCLSPAASAIDFETLVMPGPVIEGHADVEKDCQRCHRPFERGAERKLCMECHESIAGDVEASTGLHGRSPAAREGKCRDCHGEHLGRDADIMRLSEETFDHDLTDYALEGAHARVACGECHLASVKHSETPSSCIDCHREDDAHKKQLGTDCARCHSQARWDDTAFDHDKTDFRLEGRHRKVDCALCHPQARYEETPSKCGVCHALDDAHRGEFGNQCERCHDSEAWDHTRFDHTRETDFPLTGAHAKAQCVGCHSPGSKRDETDRSCVSCHRSDDDHRGGFGVDCQDCHVTSSWRRSGFDHARDASYRLDGAHDGLPCRQCHTGVIRRGAPKRDCNQCHASDDVHRGQQGTACGKCHDSRAWTGRVRFDHDLSKFPLLGLHAVATCEECHAAGRFKDAPTECRECHLADDVHEGSLGEGCQGCHNPNAWNLWRFDHDTQTNFALHGRHAELSCGACHEVGKRGARKPATRCGVCHAMDDPHGGSFGDRCESCHVGDDWGELRIGR